MRPELARWLDSAGGSFIDVKAGAAGNGLIFRVDSSVGGTDRMRITAGGNVGIGTVSPDSLLTVQGDVHGTGGLLSCVNSSPNCPASFPTLPSVGGVAPSIRQYNVSSPCSAD